MSIQGEIRTLYSDREQTQAVFPRTKMSAVSDENGVGLGALLDGKAPSGFGLGEFAKLVTSLSEITSSGFYTIVSDELPTNNGWWGVASICNARYGTLICESLDGWLIKFTLAHGVWGSLEYVNPPMVLGVEYRTTERYNGKVVYATAVNFGIVSTTITATQSVRHGIPNIVQVVRANGQIDGDMIPYHSDYYGTIHCDATRDNVRITANVTSEFPVNKTAVVQMWYTKD